MKKKLTVITALLMSALALSACKKEDQAPHYGVYGDPVSLQPIKIECSMASDCVSGLVNGKKAYASLSKVDHTGLSPLNGPSENYSNSPYKSDASSPVSCSSGFCTATANWPQQIPSGNYFLFVFIDTNGDGHPTPRVVSGGGVVVPGEPGITISPTNVSSSAQIQASGSLWYDIDSTNSYAK